MLHVLVIIRLKDISCSWEQFSDKANVLIWFPPHIERICLNKKFLQEFFNLLLTAVC
jgi:hypothetical protein